MPTISNVMDAAPSGRLRSPLLGSRARRRNTARVIYRKHDRRCIDPERIACDLAAIEARKAAERAEADRLAEAIVEIERAQAREAVARKTV